MAPYAGESNYPYETESSQIESEELSQDKTKCETTKKSEHKLIWFHVLLLTYYHVGSLYGLYLGFKSVKWATIGFGLVMYLCGALGVTAGAHRLWAHRSYKAKMPLQIILMIFHSIAFQKTIIAWARDHRVHHKCSDTDGDPHNANRGFFYCHIGWLMTTKSDRVIKELKSVDISDLYNNPVVALQKKHSLFFIGTFCFLLPTIIPMYFWGETLSNAYHFNLLRFIINLHVVCCVNSVAHMMGYKPYDRNIKSGQVPVLSIGILGEGFHNYHHAFPWDYQAAELGNMRYNMTTWFIDFFAKIGWAYDLKKAPDQLIKNRAERTGDGTDLWGAKKTLCT